MIDPDLLIQRADVIATEAVDGEIRVTIGDQFHKWTWASDCPMYGADGFIGRPNLPENDGAAQALYLQDGDQRVVVGTKDNRWTSKVGDVQPGDRVIYSNSEARFFLKREDDAICLYSTSTPTGKSMIMSLDGKAGKGLMMVGGTSIEMDGTDINIIAGSGAASIVIKGDGSICINGASLLANVGNVLLGSLPGPKEFVALATKVYDALVAMAGKYNGHTHSGAVGAPAGAEAMTASSVAATKTEAR